jgi:signal transduction histidine kinase/ligand-binding sensor domain-containing protein
VPTLVRCLIFLLSLDSLNARRLPIKTYTTADGLARDRVECALQDRTGFMWFCTAEGLSRFDGYRFTNYSTEQGLPHNYVTAMLQTREGNYWVGTAVGLCRFDPTASGAAKFRRYPLPGEKPAPKINVLRQGRDGAIWVGADGGGLFRLPKDGSSFQRVDLDKDGRGLRVMALLEDRGGALWVSTRDGMYRREPDGRTTSCRSMFRPDIGTLNMLEDRDGRLWFGTTDALWRIDGSRVPTKAISKSFKGRWVHCLLQSSDGKIWMGTSSGLTEWVPQACSADREFESYDMTNGLSGHQVTVLTEDRDGNIWIGTDGAGVMKMAASGIATYSTEDGLEKLVTDAGNMFESREGERYASFKSVISRFDGRHFIPTRPVFPHDIWYFAWGPGRHALRDRTGDWWVATGQGLCHFPSVPFDKLSRVRPKAVFRTADGLPGAEIYSLFEDSRGDIWIGVTSLPKSGMALWKRSTGRIRAFSEADGYTPSTDAPAAFVEDRAGNVWVGGLGGALSRYRNGRFTMFTDTEGVPRGSKLVYVDSAGRLWASSRGGIGRSDNPTADFPRFVSYTTAQGLASNSVFGVTEDHWGRIYLATGRGLDRLNPQGSGIGAIRHYTSADGLAAGELKTAYRDRTGNLWFSSNTGFTQLTPTADRPPSPPPVLVTGLQVGTAMYAVADTGQTDVDGPNVKPGQGPLRIDFVGLSFASGETLRYQYQLAGVDPDWSTPTEQRTVVYGQLASGAYRFLVRAINSEGMTSPQPASVAFTMLPPVWLSRWFLSLAALAAGMLVYAAHRYRVNQLLAVDRVRTRIATDLHDDIGSSLSQISILSALVRQRLDTADPQVSQPLAEMATVSGEMVAALSDIVWAINPRHDRLSDLAARMRRFALDVLGGRGIVLRFHANDAQEHRRTSADFRRQVYLIFKEAVNNAARHAGCTQAVVELQVANGRLELHMTDNGSGFEPTSAGNGNGLVNMQRRAADLNGTLDLRSEPGRGTELKLTVPLPGSRTP